MRYKKERLIDFGRQPISNRFLRNSNDKSPSFDLCLDVCTDTGIICINKPFPINEIRPKYDWITCFEPEDHLDSLVDNILCLARIDKNSVFGAYSFKDDSILDRINSYGYRESWRIQPEEDLGLDGIFSSVESYQEALTHKRVDKIVKKNGLSDVFIVRHVLEHSYDIYKFIDYIKLFVKDDGYIVWEIPDCERALDSGDCTMVWEEHVYYFTNFTFKNFLHECGFSIKHYESVNYPLENSIIAIVKKSKVQPYTVNNNLVQYEVDRAKKFVELLENRKVNIKNKLLSIFNKHGKLAIFGGGHLSVAFISILELQDLISYVVDDNANKIGMYMPIGMIPIIDSKSISEKGISICLLALNPVSHDLVIDNNKDFIENGGKFMSIFPGTNNYVEDFQENE